MPLLSEVEFASFLVYSVRGTSSVSRESKTAVMAIKENRAGMYVDASGTRISTISQYAARRVREEWDSGRLAGFEPFLARDAVLVPVPRSTRMVHGRVWPAMEIAKALRAARFGLRIEAWLERTTPVAKSAFAATGERPTASQHYDSLAVRRRLDELPTRIT